MSNSLFLAVGFFAGCLAGVALMALAAAGELRGRSAASRGRLLRSGDRSLRRSALASPGGERQARFAERSRA